MITFLIVASLPGALCLGMWIGIRSERANHRLACATAQLNREAEICDAAEMAQTACEREGTL